MEMSCKKCQLVHDTINYFTFNCPFPFGKCEKEGKKLQKAEYLENKNNFPE